MAVHQFGTGIGEAVDEDMTLCVYQGHRRMMLPTTETTMVEWENWRTQVNAVYEYEWRGWENVI